MDMAINKELEAFDSGFHQGYHRGYYQGVKDQFEAFRAVKRVKGDETR